MNECTVLPSMQRNNLLLRAVGTARSSRICVVQEVAIQAFSWRGMTEVCRSRKSTTVSCTVRYCAVRVHGHGRPGRLYISNSMCACLDLGDSITISLCFRRSACIYGVSNVRRTMGERERGNPELLLADNPIFAQKVALVPRMFHVTHHPIHQSMPKLD